MRRRILQSTMLVVTITGLVLGVPLAFTTWRLVEDFTRADLLSRLGQVVATLDDQPGVADVEAVALALPPEGQLVVDSQRAERVTLGPDPGPDPVTEALPMAERGRVTLAVPGDEMRRTQLQATALVALLLVFSIGVGTTVALVTARRLAGPLQDVADRAARLGGGDFRPVPRRYGIPELDRVADVLDTSAAALSQLVQRERDLVGDVSHQLRTRLTALQLRLDELATNPDAATAAEAEAALEQAEHLGEVLDELLRAADVARAASAEPVDLTGLLREVAEEWDPPAAAQHRSLCLRVPDGLLARVTPGRIREAIGVLVDNALRHGSGTVTVAARPGGFGRDGMVVVEVSDAGAGIPEGLAPHVFDRGVSGA
ncbi:MAG: ATP-binding protein, partial [Actinomycetota bacterium]|nr:ATP-binding protein [Actinomycetota bacterium]